DPPSQSGYATCTPPLRIPLSYTSSSAPTSTKSTPASTHPCPAMTPNESPTASTNGSPPASTAGKTPAPSTKPPSPTSKQHADAKAVKVDVVQQRTVGDLSWRLNNENWTN